MGTRRQRGKLARRIVLAEAGVLGVSGERRVSSQLQAARFPSLQKREQWSDSGRGLGGASSAAGFAGRFAYLKCRCWDSPSK